MSKFVHLEPNYISLFEVEKFFVASDVVIMPYVLCTHSGIHHMAYSFGIPVIATKCGELPETVEEGKSGFLVEPRNPDELAETILHFYSLSQNKISEMSRYCREIADEKYNWNSIAHSLVEVYDNLC